MATVSSTLANIRQKVRRLTASPSTQQISDDDIDEQINRSYCEDFPAEIKSDLFKDVVEIFVHPYKDRYALSGSINTTSAPDVNTTANTYESIREPIYVEGRRANYFTDRGQFYNAWPRTHSLNTSLTGDGSTTAFSLAIGAPILPFECVIGYLDVGGDYIKVEDGGDGILYLANTSTAAGTITYSSGSISLTLLTAPDNGQTISVWYYTYSPGRPTSVMFWKNELVVRPVPDRVYRVQVEAYKFPAAMGSTDTPEIKQWMQYLALLAAVKILADRQDMEGLENLVPLLDRQQRLVKNRKANELIGRRAPTIYAGNNQERFYFPFNYVG